MARGRVRIVAALAVAVGSALLVAVPVAPAVQVSQRFSVHRVLRSEVLGRCVDVTASGTVVARRQDRVAAVAWSGVQVRDPTIVAVGSVLVGGRCDRSRPWRMRVDLRQVWSPGDPAARTRATAEGPGARLSQFNSGTPIEVADALRLRLLGADALRVRAAVSAVAHSPTTEDALRFPVVVELR